VSYVPVFQKPHPNACDAWRTEGLLVEPTSQAKGQYRKRGVLHAENDVLEEIGRETDFVMQRREDMFSEIVVGGGGVEH
jgi:hypothetical protein